MRSDKERPSKIQDVPLAKMFAGQAQRDMKPYRVSYLVANFDLDDFGLPVVSYRGDRYYIIDGQHRIEALKQWLGEGWEKQNVQCRVYKGLSEREEADMFDRLNDVLQVNAFDKFKARVVAQRDVELRIYRIVERENLHISREKVPGAISAVGTLRRVYVRSDEETLGKTLRIIRDAFGDSGFEAQVIDGVGHLCQRYDGLLDEETAIKRLSVTHGGVKGLLGRAETIHRQTGNAKSQCVAAAAVDVINAKRGGKKLSSWWKT